MLTQLPKFVEGMPLPSVRIPALPAGIAGLWSIWEVSLVTLDRRKNSILPLFLHDDGRVLAPTGRFLWEQLCTEPWKLEAEHITEPSSDVFTQLRDHAMLQSQGIYETLKQKHQQAIKAEREKGDYSFRARRRMLSGLGLTEVRDFRLRRLGEEEEQLQIELSRQAEIMPALTPLLILRILPHS